MSPVSDSAPATADSAPGFEPPRQPHWIRRFAKLWGFAAFIIVVVFFFRAVLLPFVLATLVAYILAPAVARLTRIHIRKNRLPRGAAVLICYIILVGVLVLFFALFVPKLSSDFARIGREAPKLWERVQNVWTPKAARWLERKFPSIAPEGELPPPPPPPGSVVDLPPPPGTVFTVTPMANGDYAIAMSESAGLEIERLDDHRLVLRAKEGKSKKRLEDVIRERTLRAIAGLGDQATEVLRFGQALVMGVVTTIMKFVLVLMIAAFILIDMERIHRFLRSLVPERYQNDYDRIVEGVDSGMNGVVRGQLIICLVNGVFTYIGLLIFDVKYAPVMATLAAVMSLIPIFGSILSSIPIVAVALVSGAAGIDLFRGLAILGWILLIHFIEANFLNPKIIGSAAKMHPVLVIFALIAGEKSYGLVGALLAVPVASIIQVFFLYFRSKAWRESPAK